MAKRTFSAIGSFLDIFGSAIAVSHAIESHRQPAPHHLRTLGIDPTKFRSIGRR